MKYLLIALILLSSCKKKTITPAPNPLKGTVWLMDRYSYNAIAIPTVLGDTLDFYGDSKCYINGIEKDYSCTTIPNGMHSVIIHNTTFGNISGLLPNDITSITTSIQITFSNIQTNDKIFIWISKI